LRRLNPIVAQVLTDLRAALTPFYSEIGRPSIDPEQMIRMLIVGYCYGIRCERRLCQEVELHLAYRWFAASISKPKFLIIRHSQSIDTGASGTATSFGGCSRKWSGCVWTGGLLRAKGLRLMRA
jgi:hypothetical protein